MPTIQELERKIRSVRREVRNLTVMAMDSSQPPDQLALIKQLMIAIWFAAVWFVLFGPKPRAFQCVFDLAVLGFHFP
jgi:hypothetical protein